MAHQAKRALHEREVEVNRESLIATLTENKEKHISQYKEAIAGYKEQAMRKLKEDGERARQKLEKNLERVAESISEFDENNPGRFSDHFTLVEAVLMNMPVPRSYESEYDAAIDIAKWDVNSTMKLTFAEFNCFVRDQWDWKSEFENIHLSYTSRS